VSTGVTRKAVEEGLTTVAIVLVITFLRGLVRSKGVSKEMIWDWLATSAALSVGLFAARAIVSRYG
jgi:hypothetical protein